MKQISDFLLRITNVWTLLAATLIFAVFIAVILPQQSAASAEYSEGVGSVDTSFFYTPDDVYEIAESYGEAGRHAYITARLTFDVVWPLAYTFFFGTLISFVFKRAFLLDSRWQLANLVPVLGLLFDYGENVNISIIMAAFPLRLDWLAWLTAIFTMLKWTFVNASFAVPFIGFGVLIVKRLRRG
ncbi:MAG: hypothetical protein DWQ07_04225 [Chloroflexi bacterium]|nr:MAG: hypothetical protein DWQ07_04225 [Chloroflexota bacterium]MBL1194639.1 hypothetical protein [Chloroflexota bacterium]NOH11929.1 hypothetical protein [Chloroflexota bacterium]